MSSFPKKLKSTNSLATFLELVEGFLEIHYLANNMISSRFPFNPPRLHGKSERHHGGAIPIPVSGPCWGPTSYSPTTQSQVKSQPKHFLQRVAAEDEGKSLTPTRVRTGRLQEASIWAPDVNRRRRRRSSTAALQGGRLMTLIGPGKSAGPMCFPKSQVVMFV